MDIWDYLKHTSRPIVLYGTGNGADRVMDQLNAQNTPVAAVFAGDDFVRDRIFRGFRVQSYAQVKAQLGSFIVLMCFGSSREEVFRNVKKISAEQEFLIPDVPVYGENIFDAHFFSLHKEALSQVHRNLSDEKSRSVFENIIKFKLTGKPEYLKNAESDGSFRELISLPARPVIYDLGAYNGDTVKEYISLFPDYERIVAVEPDAVGFRKLKAAAENSRDVLPVNALIGETPGFAFINGKKGRGSHISQVGREVPVVTVDALCAGSIPDFIKMDVEGAELSALTGAENTIRDHKPLLQIAAYHRSEDLFTLPLKILSLRPDYKMYIRHKKSIPAWDTDFYFV